MRFKKQLPKSNNSKVLYKCTCYNCISVYIGKTKQCFLVRQYKHLGTSILTNKALKCNDKGATSIRKHCSQHQHNSRLDNIKVVGNNVNNFKKLFNDSQRTKLSLNDDKESMLLYLFNNDYQEFIQVEQ